MYIFNKFDMENKQTCRILVYECKKNIDHAYLYMYFKIKE